MQIPARTPTLTATTALTIDQLSGGRFLLGLGVSGPQVVEGWHGVAFGKPLAKTREYVEIVRMVWKRERPVEHKGEYYQIPYAGPDAPGLGKPLESILDGRSELPIYLAAVGAVHDALVDEVALCGPKERIRERLPRWKSSGIATLICGAVQPEALELMAELVL